MEKRWNFSGLNSKEYFLNKEEFHIPPWQWPKAQIKMNKDIVSEKKKKCKYWNDPVTSKTSFPSQNSIKWHLKIKKEREREAYAWDRLVTWRNSNFLEKKNEIKFWMCEETCSHILGYVIKSKAASIKYYLRVVYSYM